LGPSTICSFLVHQESFEVYPIPPCPGRGLMLAYS
jgi:hypothetical protein